ncbi:carboxypeptidase-like regulatory domain-containing protein [Neptunitalea lumnitzerae]|uniref:TonB-dependent receptor n=1 Tax=Neptunitalea lumnitzerae TaxID=2965509 RepID=A0ABQ5MHS2_9FLAO|nr:carboxypeptidase-like regulatory domain-containing protein [Neptunitalea sp. Y10]GLB48477.1 TonB-dependent receptor [Neptunitalea sp. Y10]
MKKRLAFFLLSIFTTFAFAQNVTVTGTVVDTQGKEPLSNVEVTVEGTTLMVHTNQDGVFTINEVPTGLQSLTIIAEGYLINSLPVEVPAEGLDLGMIFLEKDLTEEQATNLIALTESNLTDEGNGADVTSGILQASRDTYLNAAAFDFSPSFYRVRGLNTDRGKVMLNGIEMNKLYNGRPQWGNWGGLNDVTRDQEFTNGLAPSNYNFGGLIGTTNINVRASKYRPGVRVAYSNSNRSYANRAMATYSTGLLESGWAFTVAATRRWGEEGFNDGTFYNANSFFTALEYKFNDKHSLNFTAMYAPNRRGKSSPNTQEVFDLKGTSYNEYWGYQDGEKRNSRVKDVEEPIFMLNHYWDISDNVSLNTNVAYQFGKMGNSRIEFNGSRLNEDGIPVGGGSNPSPTYYQKLPSFWLGLDEGPNYTNAYLAQQEFVSNGQINWNEMYQHNFANVGGYSTYVLYEDRTDDKLFNANTILKADISENIIFNASATYKHLNSSNFAEIIDLLGGNGFLDVDNFAESGDIEQGTPDVVQNNLMNPNRIVGEGDKFKYNYNIYSDVVEGFAQAQFKYNKVDFYVAGRVTQTSYQRDGIYQSGTFPTDSYGKGEKLNFTGVSGKAGLTYKISGRHLLDVNAAYMTKAPTIRNTFSNARENHNIVDGIKEEVITSVDASYILRLPKVKGRISGFYNTIEDANEISFYYAEGVSFSTGGVQADPNAFIQEILTGIDTRNIGGEFGIEAQVTPTIKLKAAGSIMESIYNNNPDLYLTDDAGNRSQTYTSYLKNYKVATGPQRALSVGFEYRDPDYWWIGATSNFFSNAYIDVSPLTRTSSFYTNNDGQIYNDYDAEVAKELLKQEKFNSYMTVNLIGGKSWRINRKYYIGFFASINNVLNEKYKTGGFEQGRNANYRSLKEDKARQTPIFGSKYWYGYGTTYFMNVYFRF